ncbi:hypothetical protein BDZ91DRAFT_796418 [Kalaharituber pfeilii]|nr:hypothetical protein BDZ91DRAFT_796418 [Kalaharituber pfeilii]
MLATNPPHRDALLSPLPRGPSAFRSLNSPTPKHSMTVSHRLDQTDSPTSSRPETPLVMPRWRQGRSGSGVGGGTVIESWGSGGVLLNPAKISPAISPKSREEYYSHSILAIDSRIGSPGSPPLNRKKATVASLRSLVHAEQETPQKILSASELENVELSRSASVYRPPTAENGEDAYFTGIPTPEPASGKQETKALPIVNGEVDANGRSMKAQNYVNPSPAPTIIVEEETKEAVPDENRESCTPTPIPKAPAKTQAVTVENRDDAATGNTVAEKHTSEKTGANAKCTPSSTLLRLKYPSSHHATIEIQHRDSIRITTSGKGGNGCGGGARISIQVDMDSSSGSGYTSTIRTGGRKGGLSVTVRPASAELQNENVATAAVTPSSKHNSDEADRGQEDEEELVVAAPPPSTRKSKRHHNNGGSSHHGNSHRSSKHHSVIPTHQEESSVNLIELSGGEETIVPDNVHTKRRTVRKIEKSEDLKRESASGSRIHSALMSGEGAVSQYTWEQIMDRPISMDIKRGSSGVVNCLHATNIVSGGRIGGDADPIVVEDGWVGENQRRYHNEQEEEVGGWPEGVRLREQPPEGRKPRPISNSNLPVEVAWTMGYRGVTGTPGTSDQTLVQTVSPSSHPGSAPVEVAPSGIGIMGMEMEGGWI